MAGKPNSDATIPLSSLSETAVISPPAVVNHGRVIMSLETCLLPEERLSTTPSSLDGLDPETEMDLRILGCELVQTAGILLQLPQVAMATGQVLFHRFYFRKSFVRQSMETTAMACVCLASKIEEDPRRIRDVINVFNHIKQVREGKPIEPVILDQDYINLKNQVIKAERTVLKELGFCVQLKNPYKILVAYLQILGFEKHKLMVQRSWNYMNDSLRTDVFVRYSPETIVCACIYLSARDLGIVWPKTPVWYLLFGCQEKDLKDISIRILRLYNRPKPNADQLVPIVAQLHQSYQEMRLKSKQVSGQQTPVMQEVPTTFSPAVLGGGGSVALSTVAEIKSSSIESVSSAPSTGKVEEKNHVTKKSQSVESRRSSSRSRSVSRGITEKHSEKERRHKSRHHEKDHHQHHRKKRSRSRSPHDTKRRDYKDTGHRRRERSRSRDRDREKERDRHRDYKYRSKKQRSGAG
jgi:cyclin L